jgi:tetratricopeptide (TPR) repeat protein
VLRARLLAVAAGLAITQLDADAGDRVAIAVDAARASGDDRAIGTALSGQVVLGMSVDESQAWQVATEALSHLEAAGAAAKANWVRYMLALASLATGRGRAADSLASWDSRADTTQALEVQVVAMCRLQDHDHLGAVRAVRATPREVGRASSIELASETFGQNIARVRAGLEPLDPDEMLAAAAAADGNGEAHAASAYRAACAVAYAVQGRVDEARAALEGAFVWVRSTELVPLAVALQLERGDRDAAEAECRRLSERAERVDSSLLRARALWLRAWVALASGDAHGAAELGRGAVELATTGTFLRELIHALEILAASYEASGDAAGAAAAATKARRIRSETHYGWNLIGPPADQTPRHGAERASSARRARSTDTSVDSPRPVL